MLRIGIVAGEASGDYLGAELIKALKEKHGDIIVEGIGGKKNAVSRLYQLFPDGKACCNGDSRGAW